MQIIVNYQRNKINENANMFMNICKHSTSILSEFSKMHKCIIHYIHCWSLKMNVYGESLYEF